MKKNKTYPKEKFNFLNDNGSKKEPIENDNYFIWEYRFIKRFPFIKRYVVDYKLINNQWIENNKI